jgi:uncharacterized membrane protein HdeD (DUF308 family)
MIRDFGERKSIPMSMSHEVGSSGSATPVVIVNPAVELLRKEFHHLRLQWCWFFSLGILLVVCGTAAIIFPVLTSVAAAVLLGVVLMVAGIATVIATIWAGHWSGHLLQMLVGVFYLVAGFLITDTPIKAAVALTTVVAVIFILVGLSRIVAAFVVRFPHWEWAVLNGGITFLLGLVIYRHFPQGKLWLLGLLIGLELLFNGWTWIVLSLAIRRIPERAA